MISSFRKKVQANTDWGKADPAETPDVRSARVRQRRPVAGATITAHRLFPAFSALWFAALFGLGSLVISSEVLGVLVTKVGLPALVPAAAPPLGFTARLLVALVLAVVGGGFGLGLGLRLRALNGASARPAEPAPANAKSNTKTAKDADTALPKVRARDAHPDAPPRRPLVLTEAFAEPVSTLAAPLIEETPIDDVTVPVSPLLRSKPEPSQSAHLMAERDSWMPVYEPVGADALKPLDLAGLDLDTRHLADGGQATPAGPFAVPALQAEPVQASEVAPEPAPEPASAPAVQPGPPSLLAAAVQITAGELWSPVASAPLADLGLVQLIERLALTIAARNAAREAGPPPTDGTPAEGPLEDLLPEGHVVAAGEAPADEAPGPFAKPATAAPASSSFPLVSVREAMMRRLDATALPSALPTALGAGPAPFSRPQRAEAVVPLHRADHAQADEAAAAANPAPLATEEALRSALATLQRISGRG